jgi:hypothetical protein
MGKECALKKRSRFTLHPYYLRAKRSAKIFGTAKTNHKRQQIKGFSAQKLPIRNMMNLKDAQQKAKNDLDNSGKNTDACRIILKRVVNIWATVKMPKNPN